ncbi:MAG: hypothetical protein JRH17_07065 [Deltaproteobacteria bacterium]|nr:hypothetical protein [Deltaproteobacteria bacterium]
MAEAGPSWKKCSACKKPLGFGADYYVCSVSTCNRKRTALHFCSVSCWEVHLPVVRHREAWAEERTAPSATQAAREAAAEKAPAPARKPRRIIAEPSPPSAPRSESVSDAVPREILIIASRLKDYIRAVSGMNTSDRALEPLSEIVREIAQRAIENARADERKTVLDRDIPKR